MQSIAKTLPFFVVKTSFLQYNKSESVVMRLSSQEIYAIKESTQECFSPKANVYLFGSRADDTKRGGDIDLLIECEKDKNTFQNIIQFKVGLKRKIGEQKIDVVLKTNMENDDRLIVQEAMKKGVLL